MWESRVLQRAFERLELHEGKLSRAVLRGGGGGDVTSLPDTWVGNHPGLPGPSGWTPSGCGGEEVAPVLGLAEDPAIEQADHRLVDQCAGLQGVVGPLAA